MLTPTSPLLAPLLRGLDPLPQHLYSRGDNLDNILRMPRLTVVGSRKPTAYGRAVTTSVVTEVAELGVAIVSGLALGIDGVAHEAALAANTPTIAVMAGGLHEVYPGTHMGLAQRILAQGGALISEYPDGYPPQKHTFVERDRLMAALGDAVLITEATEQSGTMHTARFALDIGRPVMAVPGPITSPLSAGTNNLIKVGAIPVTSANDVLLAMGLERSKLVRQKPAAGTPEEQAILDLIGQGITDGASLLLQSRLSAAKFNQSLSMLEITGQIHPAGGDNWILVA